MLSNAKVINSLFLCGLAIYKSCIYQKKHLSKKITEVFN